jgi:hypothetical protein
MPWLQGVSAFISYSIQGLPGGLADFRQTPGNLALFETIPEVILSEIKSGGLPTR